MCKLCMMRLSHFILHSYCTMRGGCGAAWAWPAGAARTASSGGSPRLSSATCAPAGAALGDGAVAALKLAAMKLSAGSAERAGSTTPPLSPIKAAWAQPALSDAVRPWLCRAHKC